MTPQSIFWKRFPFGALAGAGSAALLLTALGFQYLGGLAPCALCIWQRWPHLVAAVAGLLCLRLNHVWVLALGAASAAASAGIGLFHAGVEAKLWQGLTSCSGNIDVSRMSAKDALEAIMSAQVVKCDEIAWSWLGLSMASWNALLSTGLAAVWIWSMIRSFR